MVLRYYLGLSVPEVADALGVPTGTAEVRIYDATEALRFAVLMGDAGVVAVGSNAIAAASGPDPLAEVRLVTAEFQRLEVATEAGYELGYLNGAGTRIITGCIAHPTAGVMGYHYFETSS